MAHACRPLACTAQPSRGLFAASARPPTRAAVLVRAASNAGAPQNAQGGRRQALLLGAAALTALAGSGGGALLPVSAAEEESIYNQSALYDNESVPFSKYKGEVRRVCTLSDRRWVVLSCAAVRRKAVSRVVGSGGGQQWMAATAAV